jgi:hypothetical protein
LLRITFSLCDDATLYGPITALSLRDFLRCHRRDRVRQDSTDAITEYARDGYGWPRDVQFYVTVGTRVLLGLLFIFAAPKCRLPRFIRTIGIIALVAGAVYFCLGRGRVDSLIQWMFGQPSMFIQLLYAVTIVFGAVFYQTMNYFKPTAVRTRVIT